VTFQRFFNTAGPIKEAMHYCIPPLQRLDLDDIMMLIEQHKYFILHAPRQVGKTSFLLALQAYLNDSKQYHCVYINVEAAQALLEDVPAANHLIAGEIASRARSSMADEFPESILEMVHQRRPTHSLGELLTEWAQQTPKPIVLLIDEIDSLVGNTLLSVLRQLRAGYDKRPTTFPQSIILCGVRNVRDYRLTTADGKILVTGGSAFNIKAQALRMGDFSRAEMETLLQQHTTETGQPFSEGVFDLIWAFTQGQPWLVNALAYEVCFTMKPNRDRSVIITTEMIHQAKENLILRRETHLDQLVDKLKEPRVHRVIAPMLAGGEYPKSVPADDVQYVLDLGLIRREGSLKIANSIYQEVIPRELTFTTQVTITHETFWYLQADGSLDMEKLLMAFQQFFREHSEHWVERFDYKEAGPQLLMQAFLQRIINGGGRVEREYGLGRKRTDLLLVWPYAETTQRVVIELKIMYHDLQKTITKGVEQTWQYMDKSGTDIGHLIIFDRTPNKPWADKIFRREERYNEQPIIVWGM